VIVLGFDTATQATVVGLRLADGRTLQARDDPPAREHPGHATRLLDMAGELLVQAEIGWRELQRIAVGVGPGRFTGLRVGVATARGLAQSLDVQLIGVSSLSALGLAAARVHPGRSILAIIDARRQEVFAAGYPAGTDFFASGEQRDGARRGGEIELRQALDGERLRGVAAELQSFAASPAQPWLAVGDGALCFASELRQGGVDVVAERSPLHAIDAGAICELGARAGAAGARDRVLPDYRRTPDAALARDRAPATEGAVS
jgi:tRNA threonylcarbamoyladenosine biosynthesis protein TsaB